jgi:hypothetical protein
MGQLLLEMPVNITKHEIPIDGHSNLRRSNKSRAAILYTHLISRTFHVKATTNLKKYLLEF